MALARWLDRVRVANPALGFQIDPVIGDRDTGVYTDPALIPVWRDALAPRAEGLTPNHFELEQLVGHTLPTLDACAQAAASLLNEVTRWVVVTSAAPDTAERWQSRDSSSLSSSESARIIACTAFVEPLTT